MLGSITVERREDDDEGLPEHDVRYSSDEAVRECVELHVKIMGELAAPIVAVEGNKALEMRLIQVTEDAARRFLENSPGHQVQR